MSLLMDALRRAELAKRQARGHQAQVPVAATKTESAATSELAIVVESDVPAHSGRSAPRSQEPGGAPSRADAAARTEADRAGAQNLFAAKPSPSRLHLYLGVGIATLLAVAGIGSYFWLQLRPVSAGIAPGVELGTAPGAPVLPAAPNIARPSTPATPKPPPPSPKPAATTSASAQAAIVSSAPAEKRNVETARSTPSPRAPAAPPIPSDQPTRGRLADEAPAAEPEPSVPIRAGSARIRINPGVAAGYQAFQSGDLTAARQAYEQVLRSEPKSSDALHGLAAVNLREGRYDAAQSLYLRALEADPKDALAHSALVNLRGQADPAQSESRIKGLLAAKPDAPYLHFSLGNLYAREGRWTEAQQAYFRAHGGDPENPDYLFNLAISLDQIRQPKLALQYYQNALTAATTRSAAFDPAQVQARIRDLQQ